MTPLESLRVRRARAEHGFAVDAEFDEGHIGAAEQRIDPEQVLAAQPLHLVFPGQVESRDDQALLIKPKGNAIVCDLRACDSAPRDEHRLLSHLFVVARKAEHHRQHFKQAVHKTVKSEKWKVKSAKSD